MYLCIGSSPIVLFLCIAGFASGREPDGFVPDNIRHGGHTATAARLPGRAEHQGYAAQHSQTV